jgi:excisionase family DNA binding protein
MAEKVVLSVSQTAAYLGISRGLAYQAVADGRLPHLRIGKRILVPKAALERLLEKAGDAEAVVNPPATLVGA